MNRVLSKKRVRTRCTLQYDATECGPAAVATILDYFGKIVSIRDLRVLCNVDRNGSNALQMLEAGKKLGLDCNPYRCSAEEIYKKGRFPCILFWGFNHYVVLEGFKGNRAFISDPDRGRVSLPYEEFADQFTGVVLEFSPNKEFVRDGKRINPFSDLMRLFVPFIGSLGMLLLLATAMTIPTFAMAALSSQFIDSFLQQERYYFGIPIVWLGTIAISTLLMLVIVQFILLRRIELILSRKITADLFRQLFSAPLAFYQQRLKGELASRLLLGLQMAQTLVAQCLRIFSTIWSSLILLLLAFVISGWLALLAITAMAGNLALNFIITKKREDDNRRFALESGKASGIALQGINILESIKASGGEFDFLNLWQSSFDTVLEQSQRLGSQIGIANTAASASNYILAVLTITVGGYLVILGKLSLGELTAFQFVQGQITAPISLIPQLSSIFQNLSGTLGRISDLTSVEIDPYVRSFDFLGGAKEETLADELSKSLQTSPAFDSVESISGSLAILKLAFSYSAAAKPYLHDINFSIAAGQKVAIVGRTGSGKSTLVKLIAGLTQPSDGQILIDGFRYLDIPNHILRSAVAYVPQDVFVFNASIWDNITCWQPGFNLEQLERAAKDACIHDKIVSHPDGYDQLLSDNGAELSGGERQRLEICRALLREPKIIILDEATSALDNQTEQSVLEAIWNRGITTVTVAHRMAAALRSDYVLVMDSGTVIEEGTPNELRAQKSVFSELVERESTSLT